MADPNSGTVHVMEEEMRDAEQGVFEPKSGAKMDATPKNKMAAEPANKADPFDHDGDGKPGGSRKGGNKRKVK